MMNPVVGLREWRSTVRQCRKCRLCPDGSEINPLDPIQRQQAQIHFELDRRPGYRSGWATAMLDKTSEVEPPEGVLERSCRSGIVAVLEAPNHDDTYRLNKGYLTYDANTDETGKRTRRLLLHIGVSPEEVIFTNAVQCLPPNYGKGPKVTSQQRLNCRDHLCRLIDIVRPKAVLAFGTEAMKELHRIDPIVLRGRRLRIDEVTAGRLAGCCIQPWMSTCLVPLYHTGPKVVAAATQKDGSPGTGRSEDDQLRDIEIVSRVLRA